MEKVIYIQLNIYAFLVCLLLYMNLKKNKQEVLGKRAFEVLTLSVMAVELLNVCSWMLEANVFLGSNLLYLVELHLQFAIQIIPNIYMLVYCLQSGRTNPANKKKERLLVIVTIGLWIVITVANLFHPYLFWIDEQNRYYRLPAFYLSILLLGILLLASMILCIYKYFKSRRTENVYFYLIMVVLITVVGVVIQMVTYYLEVIPLAETFSYVYLYIFIQSRRDDALLQQQEEAKNSALLSQIQPHFLYNSVGTIQYYCGVKPQVAKEAVDQFVTFLRGNLDSVMSQVPIYFVDEMKHVNAYLHLEKLRKQEHLTIVYEIEVKDFFLPALTIQPIVENAVKYGVSSREDGGTVTIRTKKCKDQIEILILDNGIGMDVDRIEDIPVKQDGRTHIGLLNVQKRLETMVNGQMELHSTKETGTTVRIMIPNE